MSGLGGVRIVELAEHVSGEYCGKLLSDFGAEILKIERPGSGSPTRAMAPIIQGAGGASASALFAYLNTNKKSVVLDLSSDEGINRLHALIASADVVIDDHDEEWLRRVGLVPDDAERDYPATIFCSITPFGLGAPREWWSARSLNVFHAAGWGYHTPSTPDLEKPPLKGAGRFIADYEGGLDAALAIVSSLYARGREGRGQVIDVSQQEVLVSRLDGVLGRMLAGEAEPSQARTAFDMAGPRGFYPCVDGAVYLYMTSRGHWLGLRQLMGDPAWMAEYDDNWLEFGITDEAVDKVRTAFAAWVRVKERNAVVEQAQKLGVPLVAVNDSSDLYGSEQFAFRQFFQKLSHPILGEADYPGVSYKMSGSPAKLTDPAPSLGQHDSLAQDWPGEGGGRVIARQDTGGPALHRKGPLAGVRILELTKVWAGPYAGKLLAFLGAEVIKIESNTNLDEMRGYGGVDPDHAPYFLSINPEVLSVQVNLKTKQGMEYLKAMVAQSDIVLNNIRPGAMERLGLDYEGLRAIKPDIIAASIKMYGTDGPLGYQTGYAPCFAALGGISHLVGYEPDTPLGMNTRYGDSTVGAATAFAAIVALNHRERTGEGQMVDVSAVECLASMMGDSLLEYALTGHVPQADGNVHADMAPHGAYPCRDEEWISIAVQSDEEWRALCDVLADPDLSGDLTFATLASRKRHRSMLDETLSTATAGHQAAALAARLRATGVPAFKSQTSLDVITDDYLWGRHFYRQVSDRKHGVRPIVGAPWQFSRTQLSISHGAPVLGEHNDYVYGDILGVDSETLAELMREGIVA